VAEVASVVVVAAVVVVDAAAAPATFITSNKTATETQVSLHSSQFPPKMSPRGIGIASAVPKTRPDFVSYNQNKY
jgi:hypothetical protein